MLSCSGLIPLPSWLSQVPSTNWMVFVGLCNTIYIHSHHIRFPVFSIFYNVSEIFMFRSFLITSCIILLSPEKNLVGFKKFVFPESEFYLLFNFNVQFH